MKTRIIHSATAISAFGLAVALSTSALAAEADTTFGTQPALDAICASLVNPSDSSGFTTYALGVQSSTEQITRDVGDPYTVPLGNPVTVIDGLTGPVHVNGYSPNIWAYYNRIVIYPDGAEIRINQETFTRTTYTATGCHVHKPGAGQSEVDHDSLHNDYNAPPGLQIDSGAGLTTVVDGTPTPAGYRVVQTIPGPYEDPNNVRDGQALICISPTTTDQTKKGNPGTWTAKNGYNGTLQVIGGGTESPGACSTTLWNTAFGNSNNPASGFETTPSNSLP